MAFNVIAHALSWPLSAVGPVSMAVSPVLATELILKTTTNTNISDRDHNVLLKKLLFGYVSAEMVFYLWFKHKHFAAQGHHKPQKSTKARRKEIWDGKICSWFN